MKNEILLKTYLEKAGIAPGLRNPNLAARTAGKMGLGSKLKNIGSNLYNKTNNLLGRGTSFFQAKANAANAQAALNKSKSTVGFLKNKFDGLSNGGKAAVIGGAGVAAGALLAKRKKEQNGGAPNTVIHY